MYPEKQQAKDLIEQMGWSYKIAAPKFGFDCPNSFSLFLRSDRKCVGIDFIRGLQKVRQEVEDVR